jgi:hypothetical protein
LRSPYHAKDPEVLDYPEDWFEPLERDGKVWRGNRIFRGTPLEPSEVPHRFKTKTRADRLPDMFTVQAGFMVSDILRDKIEELEPGVHRFFDAEITAKGGEKPAKRYWLFQICNLVDAIDEEKSVLRIIEGTRTYIPTGMGQGVKAKIVIHKELVEGMCIWMDKRFTEFFMSDELFEFVRKNKLTRLESRNVIAE